MNDINRVDKACVILAGAGTGKTYTIVEKLKSLIKNKVYKPQRIVCITFSNEAVDTISMRVRNSIDSNEQPIIRTFHGFSADLLRENSEKAGIDKEFRILDDDSAKIVLHSSLKVPAYYCHKYISSMSSAKDLGITVEEMEAHLNSMHSGDISNLEEKRAALQFKFQTLKQEDKSEKKKLAEELLKLSELFEFRKFVQTWKLYEKIKKKQNYLDYADLSYNALKLLRENPELSDKYDYVIVDEFQDTNKLQLDMIFSLAKKGNITVVGDMNQSIYRFRGAYKGNLEEFLKFYNLSKQDVFTLQSSYRSTNKILKVAHELILHNYSNKDECFEVKSVHDLEGDNVEVFELKNSREEARKVSEIVEKSLSEGTKLEEICVLTRTHQQSQLVKRCLELKGIPFSSVEKPSLLKQGKVKIVLDYISIVNSVLMKGKNAEQAWWDLIYQSHFSSDDLIKIGSFIKENKKEDNFGRFVLDNIQSVDLNEDGKMKIKFIVEKVNELIKNADKNVLEFVEKVYDLLGFSNYETLENKEEARLLSSFIDFVKEQTAFAGANIGGFVYHIGIISALSIDIPFAGINSEGVKIMTSHSTKGLEYKVVIITNVAQKRFPMIRSKSSPFLPLHLHPEIKSLNEEEKRQRLSDWEEFDKMHQLHEERRLFYVACTRAKRKLYMTYALDYGGKKHSASQFLDEIKFKENKDVDFKIDEDEKYPSLESSKIEETSKQYSPLNKELKFSPSSLLLFDDCQKKYEYKYVFNMPDQEIVDWTAIRLGSFVHLVLETGVKENYQTEKQFLDFAKIIHEKKEWEEVSLQDAETMIKVFFARNKNKFNTNSKTEQYLSALLEGLKFQGYADRIDFSDDGVEIIDYKTSRSQISPKHRKWQLGFYALAAQQKYGRVKALTLDMLRLEKPVSFSVNDQGDASPEFSDRMEGFNIYEVKEELISIAKSLLESYKVGFKPCSIDKHCEFCEEYVYKR